VRQHVDLDVDYATTLLAAVLLGCGFVLQQYAASSEPESRFLRLRILTDLLRKPRWLIGIGCMVAGQLLASWSTKPIGLSFGSFSHWPAAAIIAGIAFVAVQVGLRLGARRAPPSPAWR